MFVKVIFFLSAIIYSEALFGSSLKKLKNKASQMYKSKFGKDKSWHFLGHDLSEYPGTNAKYLEINEQKWEEYYQCLKIQNENLGQYLSITPEAILGFEGNNIRLECKICINPKERKSVESVEWEWAPKNKKQFQSIEITEHVIVSPDDKTLHLYNLQFENTGQYVCRLGESLTAPYFLTIVNMSENEMIEVHSPEAPLGPYPHDIEVIHSHNLILDTSWSEWSTCSNCDKIGRRHKLGYCSIYSNQEKKLTAVLNDTHEKKLDITITDLNLELLSIFKFGIPCNSHILPKSIKELPQVQSRRNEIMIGYCKVKCPKNEIFEVRDKHGKVIERANNSEGIYSMLQSLPDLEPPIERQLLYGIKGKIIIVACPGNLNSDAPIQWQIGDQNVIAELISKESKGRIFISITDRVHIKNAKISDSNVYSCWQQDALAGTVRLIIEKKFEMNFNHHIMLLGIVIILGVFLYVFVKAIAGRKFART